jgi:hypothetical protein
MGNTIQVRIPLTLHREILKIKREMERETVSKFGRKKPVTYPKAASEYHRKRNQSFFGGNLL